MGGPWWRQEEEGNAMQARFYPPFYIAQDFHFSVSEAMDGRGCASLQDPTAAQCDSREIFRCSSNCLTTILPGCRLFRKSSAQFKPDETPHLCNSLKLIIRTIYWPLREFLRLQGQIL